MIKLGLVVAWVGVVGAVPRVTAAQAAAPQLAADVTARDYKLYLGWNEGKADPKLATVKDGERLKRIAKSLGVPAKELEKVIARVDPVAKSLGPDTEASVRQSLDQTALKGRVQLVEVNAALPLVVAGVKWKCGDQRDLDKEAAIVAAAAAKGSKLVQTLGLWCVNDADTKLFSATIDRTGFEKIDPASIERFATTRYIHLFVGVQRGAHK